MNLAIWAAFLCAHHSPFPHTWGKYPNDPHKTWWATTSNDGLGQAEDNIAPPLEEEMQKAKRFYCFQVCAGVPHLMLCPCEVWDSLLVHSQVLAELCPSAIRKLENLHKYQVATYRTIDLKHRFDPRCHPMPLRNMLATICVPCMLLKDLVKCNYLPQSLV